MHGTSCGGNTLNTGKALQNRGVRCNQIFMTMNASFAAITVSSHENAFALVVIITYLYLQWEFVVSTCLPCPLLRQCNARFAWNLLQHWYFSPHKLYCTDSNTCEMHASIRYTWLTGISVKWYGFKSKFSWQDPMSVACLKVSSWSQINPVPPVYFSSWENIA